MTDTTYPPSSEFSGGAHVDLATYDAMYAASISDPEGFWGEQGQRLDWIRPYSTVKDVSYDYGNVSINWYRDGTLNVAANCIDRHLATRGDQTAIIWEPDDPNEAAQHITYKQLHAETCKMANVLKSLGVGKGDRVVLYLPMIPEAAYAMLACARIGAIHSIVFAGFSPDALGARVNGCDAKVVITADTAPRGGRVTKLKDNVNQALLQRYRRGEMPGGPSAPVIRSPGARDWITGCTKRLEKRQRPTARPSRWVPRTRSSSSTHPARPAQAQGRGAHHRRLPGLCGDDPRVGLRLSRRVTSTGARPMWAGSPATAISSMARWPMARRP